MRFENVWMDVRDIGGGGGVAVDGERGGCFCGGRRKWRRRKFLRDSHVTNSLRLLCEEKRKVLFGWKSLKRGLCDLEFIWEFFRREYSLLCCY